MTLAGFAAAALYAIVIALDAIILVFGFRTAPAPLAEGQPPLLSQLPFYLPILLAYSTVGALVAARRPRNPIGWLFLALAIMFAASLALAGYALDVHLSGSDAERAAVDRFPLGDPTTLVLIIFGFVTLLYPTGRLPSRRWWPVVLLMVGGPIAGAFYAGPGQELLGLGMPLALTAPFIRLRHASPIERRQIEWFVYFLALTVVAFIASILVSLANQNLGGLLWGVAAFCVGMTAVATGVAILRYRLYDIDVIIRRTAVYGVTTVGLAVTFFGGVLIVEALLSPFTRGNELAIAISTLASLALFQPLRRQVQTAVDRRFYRSRYDAAMTLDTFAARLRDEVDLDAVRADLVDAVRDTVQPAHASVWLRE